MPAWLDDTRTSYDTVAQGYADLVRDAAGCEPFLRGALDMFAGLVEGPVADVGCGPGHFTAYLAGRGVDAFGIDLSPGMIAVARREHPGLRFEVGSMTGLELGEASVGGLLSFFALIHVPDEEVPAVLAEFRRVLRPGGVVLVGFHAGQGSRLKTEGYGGHPMRVHVHRRTPEVVGAWLEAAGFTVQAELRERPASAAFLYARR
ncbi:class I SAM-dependent methyltransferase [Actinoplanes sp. RD1]|uniref:class I SAM-dependent methyltransferase n=1 Tax=Actinoplanes sp. RD1 TaxID=3064538 RepID=UPI002741AEA1|nr:class I SAM-dependent methyltransferase [Actinoplanes sp. RD1]